MRTPTLLLLAFWIPLVSCGTTSPSTTEAGGAPAKPSKATLPPASVARVKDRPIRLEWRNLKPSSGDLRMGLMNRSSPDQVLRYRKPEQFRDVKAVDDQVMANLLLALKKSRFFELAASGTRADDFKMGDGYGVIWLQDGEKNWTLHFKPMGAAARTSPLPRTYRDLKLLIMNVYNQTLDFAPSISRGGESFRIEPPRVPKR